MSKRVRNIWIAGGVSLLAIYLLKKYRERRQQVIGNFTPLVDHINEISDGILQQRYDFTWDDEERCLQARTTKSVETDLEGIEHTINMEHYEDRTLIVEEGADALSLLPQLKLYHLDRYGMVSAIVKRDLGGKELRYDAVMNGSELVRIEECGNEEQAAIYSWDRGNLSSITYEGGKSRTKYSYYDHIENHLFPDLNYLYLGLTDQMLSSYILGVRSRNYIKSVTEQKEGAQIQHHFSYLIDHYDRPVQIVVERTEMMAGKLKTSIREFEIVYKKS